MSIQDLPFFPIAGGTSGGVGKDGISPTITSAAIDGGHRLTIVDAAGTKTIDIMNGLDGASGKDGYSGTDGITPHIGANGNWFIGDADTGMPSLGEPGTDGKSAYQYALDGGYTGTEAEFADKLAAESPSGGGGFNDSPLELINEIVLAEEANGIGITQDSDGNPFELEDFYLQVDARTNTAGSNTVYGHITINDHFLFGTDVGFGIEAPADDYVYVLHVFNAGQAVLIGRRINSSMWGNCNMSVQPINRPITQVRLDIASSDNYQVGSKFTLYGRRVKK